MVTRVACQGQYRATYVRMVKGSVARSFRSQYTTNSAQTKKRKKRNERKKEEGSKKRDRLSTDKLVFNVRTELVDVSRTSIASIGQIAESIQQIIDRSRVTSSRSFVARPRFLFLSSIFSFAVVENSRERERKLSHSRSSNYSRRDKQNVRKLPSRIDCSAIGEMNYVGN